MTAPAHSHRRHRSARAHRRHRAWIAPSEAWLPISGVVLLFAAHWLYGALVTNVALLFGAVAAVLAGIALLRPAIREDLLRLRGLSGPALLFVATVAIAAWSLTPWGPGGANSGWAHAGIAPGAITIDKSTTTMEIAKLLGLACIFLVGAATGLRDDRARLAIHLTLGVGLVFAVWSLYGAISGTIFQSQEHRLEANFLNPNTAGTFFAVLTILAISELTRLLSQRHAEREPIALTALSATTLTFIACLLGTSSRGGVLAGIGAGMVYVAVLIACGQLKPSRLLTAMVAALVLLLLVVIMGGDALISRFFAAQQDADTRLAIWELHWGAFLKSPLLGYGLGATEIVNKTLITAQNYTFLQPIRAILNVYLEWIEDAGVLGAAPMFLCIALLITATFRRTVRRTRMLRTLAALMAANAIFLLHGATDFALQVTSMAAFWAWLLGLQFSLAQGSSQR